MAPSPFLLLLIPFFLLPHLPLHSAQEQPIYNPRCPPFDCGSLGKIHFPFSNTTHPECGWLVVDCTEDKPKIELGVGRWYDIESFPYGIEHTGTIVIQDQVLGNQLRSNSCDSLNFTLPVSPLISFEIKNLTLFKCKSDSNFPSSMNPCIYKGCNGYDMYYTYPEQSLSHLVENHPPQCSIVQLPVSEPPPQSPMKCSDNDLFTWLASEFHLQWHVLPDCWKCYLDGGQCLTNSTGGFQCVIHGDDDKTKMKIVIALSVLVGSGIIVTTMVIYSLRRKFSSEHPILPRKKKTKISQNVEAFLKNHGSYAPKRYSYSDVKVMTNSFKDKLGQGGYGGVFKGKLLDGCLVAVKVLSESKGNGEEFINEVASISQTSHVNIVSLLGYSSEGPKRALIYEFMPNGSLEKFIYNQNPLETHVLLGWEKLYQITTDIARGLEYLHRGCNMRILHFDIKPHNILLDQDFCPKISDFGLAKLCPRRESIISMTGARGTIGYIAPEVVFRNFGKVSHKSDVYSYGMMVLEMVGGRKNIDVGVDHTSEIYFPHWIYKRLEVDEDLGLHGVNSLEEGVITRKMILVGLWCIQTNPSDRPSMSRVVEMLEGSLGSLQIPPKPFLSSPSRSPPVGSSSISSSTMYPNTSLS